MGPHGHAGLTLILFSFLMMPFGYSLKAILIIGLSTGISLLPDIDLLCGWSHRKKTHTLSFALLIGLSIAIIFFFYLHDLILALAGFFAGFGGVISHLLGDSFTYKSFTPFAPISKRKIALKYFKSDDKTINSWLVLGGMIVFIFYLLIVTGRLEEIIQKYILYLHLYCFF
jgi:membrane-bound metal-dependent hydrolase YbcI (DUF457 family)